MLWGISSSHKGLLCSLPLTKGFQRVYEELGDISLDVPLAQGLLEQLVELCFDRGVITRALRDACPARFWGLEQGDGTGRLSLFIILIIVFILHRGRKRFVSEGDGGQVKQ